MLETFYIDYHCPQNLISVSYHISGQLTCLTMNQPYPPQNFSLDLNFSEEWLARPYRGQSPLTHPWLCPLWRLLASVKILPRFLGPPLVCMIIWKCWQGIYIYIYIYIYMLSIFISLLFSFRTILYVSIVYGLGNVIVAVTAVPSILESVKL